LLVAAACLAAAAACAPAPEPPADTAAPAAETVAVHPFAAAIEAAHAGETWTSHPAFASGVALELGGNAIFDGAMTLTPDAARTRIERASDGAVLVFDGDTAWVSPAGAEWPMARFHSLTWAYFLAAPYKLDDPGTRLEPLGERVLFGTPHDAARLTFEAGTGDAPDDWYVLYRQPATGRLAAMAYIVTYGGTREEAEKEPHAIVYRDYVEVGGVPVPTSWDFHLWSEEEGVHGDPIGRVKLTDPRFVDAGDETFEAPEGAREEALPATPAEAA
jgi:hypothetical protein